jgi:hypothetical protein
VQCGRSLVASKAELESLVAFFLFSPKKKAKDVDASLFKYHSRFAGCVPFDSRQPLQALIIPSTDMGHLGGFVFFFISTCTLESPHRLLRATTARCHGVAVKGVNIPVREKNEENFMVNE